MAISDKGSLYAFGPSDGGRLGLVEVPGEQGVPAPRLVRAPSLAGEKVIAAAGGDMHSACVCHSGKVSKGRGGRGGEGKGREGKGGPMFLKNMFIVDGG